MISDERIQELIDKLGRDIEVWSPFSLGHDDKVARSIALNLVEDARVVKDALLELRELREERSVERKMIQDILEIVREISSDGK